MSKTIIDLDNLYIDRLNEKDDCNVVKRKLYYHIGFFDSMDYVELSLTDLKKMADNINEEIKYQAKEGLK